jgi:CDP-4-dehydro-6-deoxyglucose reductase, E3
VNAPEDGVPIEVQCEVVSVDCLNHDVRRVLLRAPAQRPSLWCAGQYLIVRRLKGGTAFSIANAPGGRDIEIHIRYDRENGSLGEAIALLEGSTKVTIELPCGRRYIDTPPDRPLWFLCNSTGFAPMKAMLEHLRNVGFAGEVRLYWGARRRADLYLEDAAHELQRQMRNLRYTAVVSEEATQHRAPALVHDAAVVDLQAPGEPLFFVGGSPSMAWSAFDSLVARGVPPDNIHSDVYDYAPRSPAAEHGGAPP